MKRAIEQAGSMFTDWISSCFSCVWPQDESEAHQRAMSNRGIEREMKICHNQPHLVPPMKLVFYDDLPSPGPPPRSSSLPSWVVEGRNLASRASSRASMSLRRKSTARPRISAPTDFRRVQPPPARVDGFRPLELSIYMPGNRLSDLPEFDEFQIGEDGQPTLPPRAVSPTFERRFSRRCQSPSFQVARKPVGWGSNRSSVATMDQLLELRRPSVTAEPLVPHFATRTPRPSVELVGRPQLMYSDKQEGAVQQPVRGGNSPPPKKTSTDLQDRPLPPTPEDEKSPQSIPLPATPTSQSIRSGRLREWLSRGPMSTPPSSPPKSASYTPSPQHSRSRTLSGSTVSSSIGTTTGGHAMTPSLSSGITAETTTRASTTDGLAEKEIDAFPFSPKQMGVTTTRFDESPYPTIYEGELQHGYEYDARFRKSAVGVAF